MRVGRLDFQDGSLNKLGVLEALAGMAIGSGTKILTSTSTNGASTGTLEFLSGSNANGVFYRIGNLQVCWKPDLTLSYLGLVRCNATWTFPAAFKASSTPAVVPSVRDMSSATPVFGDLSETFASSTSNTSALIEIFRGTGNTNFASGDTVVVSAFAIGEWQ